MQHGHNRAWDIKWFISCMTFSCILTIGISDRLIVHGRSRPLTHLFSISCSKMACGCRQMFHSAGRFSQFCGRWALAVATGGFGSGDRRMRDVADTYGGSLQRQCNILGAVRWNKDYAAWIRRTTTLSTHTALTHCAVQLWLSVMVSTSF